MSTNKIVFKYCQDDFDYCHSLSDILAMLAGEVNASLKEKGINIEIVLEEEEC